MSRAGLMTLLSNKICLSESSRKCRLSNLIYGRCQLHLQHHGLEWLKVIVTNQCIPEGHIFFIHLIANNTFLKFLAMFFYKIYFANLLEIRKLINFTWLAKTTGHQKIDFEGLPISDMRNYLLKKFPFILVMPFDFYLQHALHIEDFLSILPEHTQAYLQVD